MFRTAASVFARLARKVVCPPPFSLALDLLLC